MEGTILLVEDDANDVFFTKKALKQAGVLHPLHVVMNGKEAIEYFDGTGRYVNREDFPLPCLTLLDLKLPFVMGLEVLKWIREHHDNGLIVIILSSSRDGQDVEKAYHLGANAYLVKPAEVHKLVELIKAVKEFWLIHNTGQGQYPYFPQVRPTQGYAVNLRP